MGHRGIAAFTNSMTKLDRAVATPLSLLSAGGAGAGAAPGAQIMANLRHRTHGQNDALQGKFRAGRNDLAPPARQHTSASAGCGSAPQMGLDKNTAEDFGHDPGQLGVCRRTLLEIPLLGKSDTRGRAGSDAVDIFTGPTQLHQQQLGVVRPLRAKTGDSRADPSCRSMQPAKRGSTPVHFSRDVTCNDALDLCPTAGSPTPHHPLRKCWFDPGADDPIRPGRHRPPPPQTRTRRRKPLRFRGSRPTAKSADCHLEQI